MSKRTAALKDTTRGCKKITTPNDACALNFIVPIVPIFHFGTLLEHSRDALFQFCSKCSKCSNCSKYIEAHVFGRARFNIHCLNFYKLSHARMFSRPKILFLVSLLFVALLNPKFNPYLLLIFNFLSF